MTLPSQALLYPALWNAHATCILPRNAQHEALELAVKEYFSQIDSQKAAEHCVAIHNMLEDYSTKHGAAQSNTQIATDMYAYVLILQVANAFLDCEGEGLAKACAAQGQPFVCREGCTGCCHQMVLCSEVEATLIALYLEKHASHKAQFLRKFSHWKQEADVISASYVRWGQAFYGEGKDDGSHCREDYYIPCPFLNEYGACYIYAVRPYACRSSVAVDKKCAETCQTTKGHRQGMHNMLFSLFTGHHNARQALMHGFENKKKDLHKTIMPYMVQDALNQ